MIKKILLVTVLGIVLVVAGFAAVVAMQPADFSVQRSATISASPEVVFAQINDFRKWEAWSPWAKLDPACKNTFEGPPAGTGAVFAWSGNDEVGEGRMTILESKPNELIRMKLDFLKPWEASCTTEFTFKSEGSQTTVNWRMSGQNSFLCKAVHLCMNCDKMIGADFEKGLASLKTVSEAAPRQ